jgi:hypothetical protein
MAKRQRSDAQAPAGATTLEGRGRQGDFIHQTQEMGTEQGFKNVSRLWLDKCLTYAQVAEKIAAGRKEIEDIKVPFVAMTPKIGDNGAFVFEYDGRAFKPTRFALGHVAGWAGVGLFDVEVLSGFRPDTNGKMRNRPQDREALMTLLGSGFSLINKHKEFLFRTQTDGTLRAWLSKDYAILDNDWFLNIIKDIIPNGMFSHWRDDGDYSTLWANVLIPDSIRAEADSDYGGMFSIGNSEIGRRNVSARPSLFRAICMNGCIWDRKSGTLFRQIHRGKNIDLMALRDKLRHHLNAQIPLVSGIIDTYLGTKKFGWDGATAKPVFATLGKDFNLSAKTNADILQSWRVQCNEEDALKGDDNPLQRTAFAVINAVTRSGTESVNPETWVKRDVMGGELLRHHEDDWRDLFRRAKSMRGEEVASLYPKSGASSN